MIFIQLWKTLYTKQTADMNSLHLWSSEEPYHSEV